MNPLCIMQGRLSPPDSGRLQAFPWPSWEEEFERAHTLGLDGLEWLFEAECYEDNPIWTEAGRRRIGVCRSTSGVRVMTLCADYFMTHPFFRVSPAERDESIEVLRRLIECADSVGIRTILIPVLEESAILSACEADHLVASLSHCFPAARRHGVRLGIEMDVPRDEYLTLVKRCSDPVVGVYYDTGNAAAQGYDIDLDLRDLADALCGVHIKDRRGGGGSVRLGEGAVTFDRCFATLAQIGYHGPLVLQTAFDEEFMGAAREHVAFVRRHLERAAAR